MLQHFPAEGRYRADHGWLRSDFSFSFSEYYDPSNMGFGPLRVLNDDVVAPNTGFGMHPHKNMEIITFVLKGELEHRDDLGNIELMKPGIVQKMTAGSGIRHSEMNPSASESVELLQLWIEPSTLQLSPGYEMVSYTEEQLAGKLHPVIAPTHPAGAGHINQDATLYLSTLTAGQSLQYSLGSSRRGFLFVIEGELLINEDQHVRRRDSLRISEEPVLTWTAQTDARILFIDLV